MQPVGELPPAVRTVPLPQCAVPIILDAAALSSSGTLEPKERTPAIPHGICSARSIAAASPTEPLCPRRSRVQLRRLSAGGVQERGSAKRAVRAGVSRSGEASAYSAC
eukprot:2005293-Prymnesium_polylepis.2